MGTLNQNPGASGNVFQGGNAPDPFAQPSGNAASLNNPLTFQTRPQPNGPFTPGPATGTAQGAAPPTSFGNPGWKPSYAPPGGYNPFQYADDKTSNELAKALGGNVFRTTTLGPFGDFGQNLIDFGPGQQYNAGLVADRYSKYDRATADAMMAAERALGPAVTDPNAGAVFMSPNGQTSQDAVRQTLPVGHDPSTPGGHSTLPPTPGYWDPLRPPGTNFPGMPTGQPGPNPLPLSPLTPPIYNPLTPVGGGLPGNFQNPRAFRGGFGQAQNFHRANPASNPLMQALMQLLGGGAQQGIRVRSNPLGNGGSMADFASLLNLLNAGVNAANRTGSMRPYDDMTAHDKFGNIIAV